MAWWILFFMALRKEGSKKMIIVRFQGGLGNQLFQYALYKELKSYRDDVKADMTVFDRGIDKRAYRLRSVFGIEVDVATPWEIFKVSGGECNIIGKAVRKFVLKNNIVRDNNNNTIQEIVNRKDAYLYGYWQSEKWFKEVKEQLYTELRLKNDWEAEEANSVSVHVRLGDYLELQDLYGGICTEEYYIKAIQYMREHLEQPKFYIFSDDIKLARKILGTHEDMMYIDNEGDDIRDLQMMSACKHHILANSSFSWWGCWLNRTKGGIVVAPKQWNKIDDPQDIYQDDWIRI